MGRKDLIENERDFGEGGGKNLQVTVCTMGIATHHTDAYILLCVAVSPSIA